MKKLLSFLTLAALACSVPTLASAAKKTTPTPAPSTPAPAAAPAATPAAKAKQFPFNGDIATVDASAKTFTFKSQKGNVRTYHVGSTAKITKDSKDGPAADFSIVTVGGYAAGSCTKTADNKYEVVSLHVGAKPAPKPKAAKATPAPKS